MTYEQDPPAHLKTEFGFDVLQVAHGLYAPQSYHDFIGFKVAKPVLERAFQDVYCIPLNKLFKSEDLALGTYRRAVGTLIPESTKVAWNLKQDEIVKLEPGMTKHRFLYNLSRASYEKEWDEEYERPGILARILAFLFRLIPKVGPFRGLSFRPPTPETEKLFMESFNRTLAEYRRLLGELKARRLALPNTDLDTGRPTQPGEYRMADAAYAQLLGKLANGDFEGLSPDLRGNLLWYYRDPNAAVAGLRKKEDQQKTLAALERLRGTRIRACVSCEAGTSGRDCACHVTGM
jgi:hypothetical protein